MAAVTICSDFGAPQNKVWHCFHCFPIYFPWSDGTRWHDFVFWMLSFKTTFSLSSFTFIKRLFSSSSLSAVRVVSSAYLRLLGLGKRWPDEVFQGGWKSDIREVSHDEDLGNCETGIRRLEIKINMSLLQSGLNNYENYGYREVSKC